MEKENMTLRQYAAIKLKVPDSGEEWLDDMIRKSLIDEFSQKVCMELLTDAKFSEDPVRAVTKAPERAFFFAKAWIAERNKQ